MKNTADNQPAPEEENESSTQRHVSDMNSHARKHGWLSDDDPDITLEELTNPDSLSEDRTREIKDFLDKYGDKLAAHLKLIMVHGDSLAEESIKIFREAREKFRNMLQEEQ
jgi:hypothetical protein